MGFFDEFKSAELITQEQPPRTTIPQIEQRRESHYMPSGFFDEFKSAEIVPSLPEETKPELPSTPAERPEKKLIDMRGEERRQEFGRLVREKGAETIRGLEELTRKAPGDITKIGLEIGEAAVDIGKLALNLTNKEERNEFVRIGKEVLKQAPGLIKDFSSKFINDKEFRDQVLTAVKNRAEERPYATAFDVSIVGGLLGKAVKGAGAVSKFVRLAKAGEKVTKVGRKVEAISKAVDPLAAIGRKLKTPEIKKVVRNLFKNISEKIPEGAFKLKKTDIDRIGRENLGGVVAEKWVTDRRITGTPKQIIKKLDDISEKSRKLVDSKLAAIPDKFRSDALRNILRELNRSFRNVTSREFIELKDNIIKLFDKVKLVRVPIEKKVPQGLTLTEMNKAKRLLDNFLSPYKKNSLLKENIKALDISNHRRALRKFIERQAAKRGISNIKELNRDTAVSRSISDGLKATLTRKPKQILPRFRDLLLSGLVGKATFDTPGAIAALSLHIGIPVADRFVKSVSFRTKVGSLLKSLSGQEKKIIQVAMETGKKTKESNRILRNVLNQAKKAAISQQRVKEIKETQE